jgi:hypothetical protein
MGEESGELSGSSPAGLLNHSLPEDNFGIGSNMKSVLDHGIDLRSSYDW